MQIYLEWQVNTIHDQIQNNLFGYGGHSWKKLGSRNLDAQAVFPLSTDILASKGF